MTARTRKSPSSSRPQSARRSPSHKDELLDEALDQSFPASDPPAMLEPTTRRRGRRERAPSAGGREAEGRSGPAGRADVVRLFGDIEDHKIVEILATGASFREMEEAAAWLVREDDVMGNLRRPLTGKAARVYEIVGREEEELDEDTARR